MRNPEQDTSVSNTNTSVKSSPKDDVASSESSSSAARRDSTSSSSAAAISRQSSFLRVTPNASRRVTIMTAEAAAVNNLATKSPEPSRNDYFDLILSDATYVQDDLSTKVQSSEEAISRSSKILTDRDRDRDKKGSIMKNKKDVRRLMRRLSSGLSCRSFLTNDSTNSIDLSISDIKEKVDALESLISKYGIDDNLSADSWSMNSNDNEEEEGNDDDEDFDYQKTIIMIENVLNDLKNSELSSEIDCSEHDSRRSEHEINHSEHKIHQKSTNLDVTKIFSTAKELDQQSDHPMQTVEKILMDEDVLPFSVVELKTYVYLEDGRRQSRERKSKTRSQCESIAEINTANHTTTKPGIFRSGSGDNKYNNAGRQSVGKFFGNGIFSSMLAKPSSSEIKPQRTASAKEYASLDESNQHGHSMHHDDDSLPQEIPLDTNFMPLESFCVKSIDTDAPLKEEAFILYLIFRKFSSPAPTFDCIKNLLENERVRIEQAIGKNDLDQKETTDGVFLPQDVVINMGDSSSEFPNRLVKEESSLVASLLKSADVVMKLPMHFRMAFFRVLIRLLTGETDAEYDCALSLVPPENSEATGREPNQNTHSTKAGMAPITPPSTGRQIYSKYGRALSTSKTESWTQRNEDLRHLYERNKKRYNLSFHCLYSVVRFRCGNKVGSQADVVLDMIEMLLQPIPNEGPMSDVNLMGPLCRLLGLLCTAGIPPQQLSRILTLIKDKNFRMNVNIHVLRALIIATEGSSLASKLRGKASPQHFFCFGRSNGLSQTVHSSTNSKAGGGWPFKSNFGMACWFRVERFASSDLDGSSSCQVLFKICSGDGTAFEVSFKRLKSRGSKSDDAAHILFSVRDSDRSKKIAQTQLSRSIEVTGFPIVPRVWFHLAVRHTKKNYLAISKDEVTILLDGKPMLTEQLKFPKASTISDGSGVKQEPIQPIEVTFCTGLDAEAGTLYVFDDIVTDETLKSLSTFTSGKVQNNTRDAIPSGIIATIEKKVNPLPLAPFLGDTNPMMAMKTADVDEMHVISSSNSKMSACKRDMLSSTLDLIGDDELQNEMHNPTNGEFSRQAFVSNIYFVWDPTRTSDHRTILEAHSGIHATLDRWNCVPWQMRSSKEVIKSIGGVQALLPVLKAMIFPDDASKSLNAFNDIEQAQMGAAVPLAFALITAFLRDNDDNGREWLRCGGTEIVEHFLLQSKKRYGIPSHRKGFWGVINAFRWHFYIAEELVSVLIDLKEACMYNSHLESKLYSRLLVNIDLWLGGLSDTPGVALHVVMLPTISSLVKADPDDAMKVINTSLMLNWIREYTIVPPKLNRSGCFDEKPHDRLLTPTERSHFVDVIMGILLTILSLEVKTSNLLPLIQFISFNLDNEWEANNAKSDGIEFTENATETRRQRFEASEKSCALLMLLLETRPVISGLFETLNEILGDTVSWLLCCMVHR